MRTVAETMKLSDMPHTGGEWRDADRWYVVGSEDGYLTNIAEARVHEDDAAYIAALHNTLPAYEALEEAARLMQRNINLGTPIDSTAFLSARSTLDVALDALAKAKEES